MNDFEGLLVTDWGFKPQGNSVPIAASKGTSNLPDGSLNFDLGPRGAPRSTRISNSNIRSLPDDRDSFSGSMGHHKNHDFRGLDYMRGGSRRTNKSEDRGGNPNFNYDYASRESSNSGAVPLNSPVYDKPVYDDDIFVGVPGLKSSSKLKHDDVFSSVPEPVSKSTNGKGLRNNEKGVPAFDDLLPGFGRNNSPADSSTSGATYSSESTSAKSNSTAVDDQLKEPGRYADPLDDISKYNSSGSKKVDSSSASKGRVFEDVDPFAGLAKSVPAFSSVGNNGRNNKSPFRTDVTTSNSRTSNSKEASKKPMVRSPEHHVKEDVSVENDKQSDQTRFDMPEDTSNAHRFVHKSASPPSYATTSSKDSDRQGGMSPRFEENFDRPDEIWITVSEVPLFTQPTSTPPPSRPPPPIPVQFYKDRAASSTVRTAGKLVDDFTPSLNFTRYYQVPKTAPAAASSSDLSPRDEIDNFNVTRSRNNVDKVVNSLSGEEQERNSAAAAMKEAMDRAQAKFRHAKEVRERESTKTAISKESGQDERAQKQERIVHEQTQSERKVEEREQRRIEKEREMAREIERERDEREREQRRLEKERERARELDRERDKARQAVERATREARQRAAAEAHSKADRAAVEKANAEARERAERAAVQRAQAEARQRAAADARERAEKAAAEARERANAEARERANEEAKDREARERAAAVRAESEARARVQRAAVERATMEARERAAALAREMAASAARVNQHNNDNDLESFFVGRASSSPRPWVNSSDTTFDTQQSRQEPVVAKTPSGTSSSMWKTSSTTKVVDDLSSIFGAAPSSGEFQEVEGESEERRRARLERQQRTQERAAKALAEKNQRDLQIQRDQAERHRIAETLDVEIKRWAAGKEGNLRALLSTLQYVLWPESGWQTVSLTDMITAASVKKVYRKATLCVHPDKVQQKGATLQQKYVAEKVFDILKEAWNKFNSEELF